MTTAADYWPFTNPNALTLTIAAAMQHATSDELDPSERAILATVAQLTSPDGICRAPHRAIKKLSQVTTNSFGTLISILRRKGWLQLGTETASYIPAIPLHIAARNHQ